MKAKCFMLVLCAYEAVSQEKMQWIKPIFHSLSGSDICVCNFRCLEDCAPEAGKLMTIVDLYNMELLHDARIQAHFLRLKAREDLLA